MKSIICKALPIAVTTVVALGITAPGYGAPNNPPSFEPGFVPVVSPCDGEFVMADWAVNVTDGDGETSGLSFLITGISNPEIFVQFPFVSWPSLTLSYRLKPGTPAGSSSQVTAVLIDTSGTGQGGSDTSEPVTWTITTAGCVDEDLDGVEDSIDPEILFIDTDGDGIHDAVDTDDDNDGLSDLQEGNGVVDTDGDGIPDSLDTDSDNDGIPDAQETGDSDGDGIPDSQEPNNTDVSTDTDGDGIPDDIDTDDDNDGLSDDEEGNGLVDTDGDGIPDSLDPDSNNDGIGDNESPQVDPQAGIVNGVVETGLNGGGCSLTGKSAFDPVLLLLAAFAGLGLMRRRKIQQVRAD